MQVPPCRLGSAQGDWEYRNVAPAPSQDYIRAIHAHSLRSITKSTFPGPNYIDIATWLLQDADPAPSPLPDPHCLAIFYDLSAHNNEKLRGLYCQDIENIVCQSRPSAGLGQLLFLRGFLPPAWIGALGSQYGIDPEFVHRHLEFFADSVHRKVFSLPSLISTTNNIIRLCVNTILFQDRPFVSGNWHRELHRCRQERADRFGTYRRQLKTRARRGDSLVRAFSTLDGQYSIIEQWISIAIMKNGNGWLGVVWMDNGRDLSASPQGPWNTELASQTSTFPVIQHHPKMTTRKTAEHDHRPPTPSPSVTPGNPNARTCIPLPGPTPQSASLLPLDYDSLLSMANLTKCAAADPLAALAPLFTHAAFSEVQFLNLMQEQLDAELGPLVPQEHHHEFGLENLQYFASILDRHVCQLRHCLRAINLLAHPSESQRPSRDQSQTGKSIASVKTFINTDQDQGSWDTDHIHHKLPHLAPSAASSGHALIENYTDLLSRCLDLLSRCNAGMNIMMNRSVVLESRKAIEQTDRVKKLTFLATFFIPLSFTASLFGMNFRVFGQGHLGIWIFPTVAVPITLLTYAFYVWDVERSIKEVVRWWDGRTRGGRK